MFRIGEFAQIAQVSSRQLRHYDQLGLLRPDHTDRQSGYRYYSITQLPRLNRLLALMDLGLTLGQIGPMLEDQISPSELRGMLAMKRAQVEQSLHAEENRLRHIESRIAQIDREGAITGYDVIVKSVAACPFLSMRQSFESPSEVISTICAVSEEGMQSIRPNLRDKFIVLNRNEEDTDTLDLEIGFSLTRQSNQILRISSVGPLAVSELPAAEMATIVRPGTNVASHSSFAVIGTWIEANACEISGPCREVFLEPITGVTGFERALVEIQFPIRPAA